MYLRTKREQHSIEVAARMRLSTRVLLRWLGPRLFREVFDPVIRQAYTRGAISPHALDELRREFDPHQPGAVGLATGHTAI